VNSVALRHQLQAKIGHDVHRLLPALHGLLNNLTDAQNLQAMDELTELDGLLHGLQAGLRNATSPAASLDASRLTMEVEASASTTTLPLQTSAHGTCFNVPETPSSTRTLSVYHGKKRKGRPQLLPPSPERKQKRKDSHAPL